MKFCKAEIDVVIAASPRITIPFNKLSLSQDCQVRPSGSTSRMSIAKLAASGLRKHRHPRSYDPPKTRREDGPTFKVAYQRS